jgi:hypothetical protein
MSIDRDRTEHETYETFLNKELKINQEMAKCNPYENGWKELLKRIEAKTTWGKNELKQLMLECLINQKE